MPSQSNFQTFVYQAPARAAGYIHITSTVGGPAFYITISGVRFEFELDLNGIVEPGRIRIPAVSGDYPATALVAYTIISENIGHLISLSVDGAFIDFDGVTPEIDIEVGVLVAGIVPLVTQSAQRRRSAALSIFERVVTSSDVSRLKMIILTSIDVISFASPIFRVSLTNSQMYAWSGAMTIAGNKVTLAGTASPFVAGHVLQLFVLGDRSES
jgi:hypothetical protein